MLPPLKKEATSLCILFLLPDNRCCSLAAWLGENVCWEIELDFLLVFFILFIHAPFSFLVLLLLTLLFPAFFVVVVVVYFFLIQSLQLLIIY